MVDVILGVVIGGMVLAAAWYIIKAKRSGAKCIGCPASGSCCACSSGEGSGCSCGRGGGEQPCSCHSEKP